MAISKLRSFADNIRYLADRVPAAAPRSQHALANLRWLLSRQAGLVVRYVRSYQPIQTTIAPLQAVSALLECARWKALEATDRFIAADPHKWAIFHEPQITGGWAYFLNGPHSLARCQAAFDAAWKARADVPEIACVEGVYAELDKLDLLVLAETADDRRVALCIEAKFGHSLAEAQLNGYVEKVAKHRGSDDTKDRAMLVLAPSLRADVRSALTSASEWQFQTWQEWLIRFENALPRYADDPDFCRFRRTTLERARVEAR